MIDKPPKVETKTTSKSKRIQRGVQSPRPDAGDSGQQCSRKADRERHLAEKFFAHLGVRIERVESGPVEQAPDVKVECILDGKRRTIWVELTDYQVDQKPGGGGSPARLTCNVGRRTLDRAQEIFAGQCPSISLEVMVRFDHEALPRKDQIEPLAQELAAFLRDHAAQGCRQPITFNRRPRAFDAYPLLQSHVESIILFRTSHLPYWQLNNARHIHLSPEILADRISSKNEKRAGYKGIQAGEDCWLVIVASGETSADRAGPEIAAAGIVDNPAVLQAAGQGAFERIYFWEAVRNWHRLIWPAESAAD